MCVCARTCTQALSQLTGSVTGGMSLQRTEDLCKSIRSLQEMYQKKHDTITSLRAELVTAGQVGPLLTDVVWCGDAVCLFSRYQLWREWNAVITIIMTM